MSKGLIVQNIEQKLKEIDLTVDRNYVVAMKSPAITKKNIPESLIDILTKDRYILAVDENSVAFIPLTLNGNLKEIDPVVLPKKDVSMSWQNGVIQNKVSLVIDNNHLQIDIPKRMFRQSWQQDNWENIKKYYV